VRIITKLASPQIHMAIRTTPFDSPVRSASFVAAIGQLNRHGPVVESCCGCRTRWSGSSRSVVGVGPIRKKPQRFRPARTASSSPSCRGSCLADLLPISVRYIGELGTIKRRPASWPRPACCAVVHDAVDVNVTHILECCQPPGLRGTHATVDRRGDGASPAWS